MVRLFLLIFAASAAVPGRAANFSDLRPGTRAMGMGYAYTALSDDIYGMFHNPAGLARKNFTELSGSFGRMMSHKGNVGTESFAYVRPLPILPGATIGAAWSSIGQRAEADLGKKEKNELLLHFSRSIKLPQLYLRRPLKVGANFKFIQGAPGDSSGGGKLGLGFDTGVIFDSGRKLKIGLSVLDLTTQTDLPHPTLSLGAAYRWKRRFTLAADLRIREGITELYPGIEVDFLQRLLRFRVGKGVPLDAKNTIALGLGANFSPLIIDFAMTIPFNGLNRNAGGFQVGLTYRFGAPPFYGRFVGAAAREAESLRSDIFQLERRKDDLDTRVSTLDSDRVGLEGQVQAQEERLRELSDEIRTIEYDLEKKQYELGHAAPQPEPAPVVTSRPKRKRKPQPKVKPRRRYPRRHRVRPGDTLRKLSDRYYGDPTLWERIYNTNPDKVERGLPIEGAVLVIPAPERR